MLWLFTREVGGLLQASIGKLKDFFVMYVGEKKKEMRDYDLRQSVSLAFTFIHSST